MMKAQPVKKISVNQSIKAEKLRLKVGSAKAAKVAMGGNTNISVWSSVRVINATHRASAINHRGRTKCRLQLCDNHWRRHCHSVHRTNGHAGHMNHTSKSTKPRQLFQSLAVEDMRQ